MLSILESNLLIDFLGQDNLVQDNPSQKQYFSPPSEALMNVLSTPQLNFSQTYESNDYSNHQISAKNGFNPEESIHTQKFRLEDE